MVTERDWFAVLKETLDSERPEATVEAHDVEAMIADIVSGRTQAVERPRLGRSRRRWIAIGTVIGVFGGGATAVALWHIARPEHPQEGISCHASPDVVGTGMLILPPTADPIRACTELWLTGRLPHVVHEGTSSDAVPTLFACVGSGGGLDVFPNLTEPAVSCSDLGLADAIIDEAEDPLVALQARLTSDINTKCLDLETAQRLAHAALSDLGLAGWTVTTRERPRECVKAGQDAGARSVYLFMPPNQQQP